MFDGGSISTSSRGASDVTGSVRPRGRIPRRSLHCAPVFAIASGKGGVGKTSVTANLAVALIHKRQKVLAIDADVGLGNLDLLLGARPVHTIADFFSGAAALDECVMTTTQGVLLLPGANGIQSLTSLSTAQKLILASALENWARQVDIVLIDTCSGIADAATYFAAAAQEIIVVVTPEPASLTDAYALIKVLASTFGEKHFHILANKVADEAESRRLFDSLSSAAVRFLNVSLDYLGCISRDAEFLVAVARSRLVVEEAKNTPSARSFDVLANRIIELSGVGGRIKENHQFFLSQALKATEGTR